MLNVKYTYEKTFFTCSIIKFYKLFHVIKIHSIQLYMQIHKLFSPGIFKSSMLKDMCKIEKRHRVG